ncbi:hypothetical protein HYQ46_008915 [Verticillium longisporum]|nr:hypothetical protein HYQ46_008915 [Verticillium longisporum]
MAWVFIKSPKPAFDEYMALIMMCAELPSIGEDCTPYAGRLNCSGDRSRCRRRCGVKIIIFLEMGFTTAIGFLSELSKLKRPTRG